jgi:hypothetical protein
MASTRTPRQNVRGTVLLLALLFVLAVPGRANAAPTAPAPQTPADGASVTLPLTISWSQSSDPSGILAYNWQVSTSSTFASIARQDSVTAPAARATVSGLAIGTYFWRVQAVSNDVVQGPWSAVRSFRVTGAGAGVPAAPTLNQPRGGNSFHPWELFGMSWNGVPGAVSYVLEASKDAAFPVNGVVFQWQQPTPSRDILITTVDRGNYNARVFAVDANGNYSMPSNVITFSITFNAPIAAPPTLVSPTGGASAPLAVTFKWNHVINPQDSGYQLQVADDSGFTQIEQDVPFLNGPTYTVLQLNKPGPKFWRVRSFQGVIDTAGTAAVTAWSRVGTFVLPDGPLQVNTITLTRSAPASGQEVFVDLQLSKGAPAGGATVTLSSSNAQAAPLPATVSVPATNSWVEARFVTGQVDTPTTVTMTAKIGTALTTKTFTVSPSSLLSLDGLPPNQNGGVTIGGIVMLNGQAPAGGAVVSLSSSSPAVQPPANVTVPAGVESVSFTATTRQVSANTPVTITATWRGASVQGTTTLTPQPPPTSLTLDPTLTTGSNGSNGRVTAADPRNGDVTFSLSSSRPDVAQVPTAVTVPQFAAAGGFIISTTPPSTRTVVTISVSGGGVTLTATLTVDPFPSTPPPAALATLSLSPSTLTGGATSTGVVTSTQTAPAGGLAVTLSSSDTTVATVPASVTIAAGASSASFTVSTSAGTTTRTATITGSAGGATQSAVLTTNASGTSPPPIDTVTISRAEWKSGALRVDATSSNASATLKVYVTSTGALLGTISGGRLQTTTSTSPGSVTVKSSAGGQATRTVTG